VVQKGHFLIYFNGKRYFGNSSRNFKKHIKIIVYKNTVLVVDLIYFSHAVQNVKLRLFNNKRVIS
jgi:hypothetical protein